MTRYQDEVNRVYSKLTKEQLNKQRDKFRKSKVKHELGKYVKSVEEMNRRLYEST